MSAQHEWENTGSEIPLGEDNVMQKVQCKVCTTRGAIVLDGVGDEKAAAVKKAYEDLAQRFPICEPGRRDPNGG